MKVLVSRAGRAVAFVWMLAAAFIGVDCAFASVVLAATLLDPMDLAIWQRAAAAAIALVESLAWFWTLRFMLLVGKRSDFAPAAASRQARVFAAMGLAGGLFALYSERLDPRAGYLFEFLYARWQVAGLIGVSSLLVAAVLLVSMRRRARES